MMSRQRSSCLAALGFLVAACGDAPPAPTPIVSPNPPTGTNTSGQTNALEALPASSGPLQDAEAPAALRTPSADAGARPAPAASVPANSKSSVDAGVSGSSAAGNSASGVFDACSAPRITGCEDLFITFRQPAADLCVQLSLDNCGVFRGALIIDAPVTWRLSSATLGSADACDLGSYDPKSISAISATGSITGVDDGISLSQVEINLTLQLPPTAPNTAPVSVKTDKPIAASPRCDAR